MLTSGTACAYRQCMAPAFEISLSAPRLLLPIFSTGFLFCGLILFSYLYYRSRVPVFLGSLPMLLSALTFTGGEAMLLLSGGWMHDAGLGLQFHRISQAGAASFIFTMPLFLSTVIETGPRERLVMRACITACLLGFGRNRRSRIYRARPFHLDGRAQEVVACQRGGLRQGERGRPSTSPGMRYWGSWPSSSLRVPRRRWSAAGAHARCRRCWEGSSSPCTWPRMISSTSISAFT